MKNLTIVALVIIALILACAQAGMDSEKPLIQSKHTTVPCSDTIYTDKSFCINGGSDLCSTMPNFIDLGTMLGYAAELVPGTQVHFDNFGWQAFVALNWPADGGSITDTEGDRVWERFYTPEEVFGANSICKSGNTARGGKKKLSLTAKAVPHIAATDTLGDFLNAAGHPLIDKNLNFVLYEVRMNEKEKEYICDSNRYTKAGLKGFINSPTLNC